MFSFSEGTETQQQHKSSGRQTDKALRKNQEAMERAHHLVLVRAKL
jgi:hypothetical protein